MNVKSLNVVEETQVQERVETAVRNVIGGAPENRDTLEESYSQHTLLTNAIDKRVRDPAINKTPYKTKTNRRGLEADF